jgi:hypothetical protein
MKKDINVKSKKSSKEQPLEKSRGCDIKLDKDTLEFFRQNEKELIVKYGLDLAIPE